MWNSEIEFVNQDHREVYALTKNIPGWQAPGDSERLYEMAYKAGDVILEIGMYAGRSAAVELKGALANPQRQSPPLYFGIDINIAAIFRSLKNLDELNLFQHAMGFYGDLEKFVEQFDIQPTMVFVDGDHRYDGVKKDLATLADFLVPDTPVLCHDYASDKNDSGQIGVRRAVDEFVADGWARWIGVSGCSAFVVTTNRCRGQHRPKWKPSQFVEKKSSLLWPYSKELSRLHEYRHKELENLKKQFEAVRDAA